MVESNFVAVNHGNFYLSEKKWCRMNASECRRHLYWECPILDTPKSRVTITTDSLTSRAAHFSSTLVPVKLRASHVSCGASFI